MTWSRPSAKSLRQPPAAPTSTYVYNQPSTIGCLSPSLQRSPWLVYLTGVDAQWTSHLPTCVQLSTHFLLDPQSVWVSTTCSFYPSHPLHGGKNCNGLNCWRRVSLIAFNSLKIINLPTSHQLIILLPISVFLFDFAGIIHRMSIHF